MSYPAPPSAGLAALLSAFLLAQPALAEDVHVDFKTQGTVTAPVLEFGVLSISADDGVAPASVYMLNLNGIGVVGGSSDSMTDGSEALHFRFDAAVTGVRYGVFVANNLDGDAFVGESFVEAFVGATSLGVVPTHDTGWHDVSAMFGGVAITGFDVRADVDGNRIDQIEFTTNWDDLGHALAGTHGPPALVGAGALVAGLPASLELSGALESSVTAFLVGAAIVDLPAFGGTVVPAFQPPLGLVILKPTTSTGDATLAAPWPPNTPSGAQFAFQCWTLDPGAPQGFSASNAVQGTVP